MHQSSRLPRDRSDPSVSPVAWCRETGDTRIVSDFYASLSLYINSLLNAAAFTGVGNMFYQ